MKLPLVLLLLTGCATFEPAPYWIKVRAEPVPVKATVWVDENPICNGVEAWGCSDPATGIVTMSKKAPPLLWDCLLKHEKEMHLERGYSHVEDGIALGGIWCDLNEFQRRPV